MAYFPTGLTASWDPFHPFWPEYTPFWDPVLVVTQDQLAGWVEIGSFLKTTFLSICSTFTTYSAKVACHPAIDEV